MSDAAHPQTPRTAVVTGAGRGIGRGLALGLARAGYAVALVGRNRDTLEAVALEISDGPAEHEAVVVVADVSDPDAVTAAAQQIEGAFGAQGGVGLLVNNAGVIEQQEKPFAEDDVADVWRVIEVNVRGPLLLTHALLPGMLARGGGRIVNINSGSAFRRSETYTGYGISKGALARFTTLLDSQYRDQGLRTFDLAPGVVVTDMTRAMPLHEERTEWTPIEASVDLVVGIGDGQLDALSGRFLRAGSDDLASLSTHAYDILVADSRRLAVLPWGHDDPLQP
ncbi:SDR family oxidoreductase [Cellulomonas sp. APG4]|uniref:SDR family NAD(P)-dependent oxidoreductase n=1 Tax=Cellulomonas sp. APG4 TaxID=1538656 RepID=UPI00137AAED1|nr:SDR family oxidoreductase [Cellulomonas sp. APG4]NCT91869.1 SDR family oxidoreductase [Cellulomonas sp. APG4]